MPKASSKKLFTAAIITLSMVLSTKVFAANVTSTGNVNVRSGPGTSYRILTVMSKGAKGNSISSSSGWTKITVNGVTGYVSSKYLTSSSNSSTTESTSNKIVYVTASSLNVRSGAGTSYSVIGSLKRDKAVTVVSTFGNWYKIKYGSSYGYISISYTSPTLYTSSTAQTTNSSQNKTMYCTASALNVRSGAGTSYSVIGSLTKGTSATVISSSNGWSKIKYGSGYGYVSSNYLSSTKSQTTSSTQSIDGSSIISYAKQFLGCKYVWGSAGPNTFDCSGFTQYVYKHFGISIPRVSADQYSQSKKISKSQLRVGDLVFFSNDTSNGKVAHVGIYIGNNQMIHAANSRDNLCISSLSESYYTKYYVGCGRYL